MCKLACQKGQDSSQDQTPNSWGKVTLSKATESTFAVYRVYGESHGQNF